MNRRYLHRRNGIWHFRMPVPKCHQTKLRRKELTVSLATPHYNHARAIANLLEFKILTGLFTMDESEFNSKVDRTVRRFLLTTLKWCDVMVRAGNNPRPSSLYVIKKLNAGLDKKLNTVYNMIAERKSLKDTIDENAKLRCELEEAFESKGERSLEAKAAYLALQASEDKFEAQPYRMVKFDGKDCLFTTQKPDSSSLNRFVTSIDDNVGNFTYEEYSLLNKKIDRAIGLLQEIYNRRFDGIDGYPKSSEFGEVLNEHFNGEKPRTITDDFERYLNHKDFTPSTERKKRDSLKLFIELWGVKPPSVSPFIELGISGEYDAMRPRRSSRYEDASLSFPSQLPVVLEAGNSNCYAA